MLAIQSNAIKAVSKSLARSIKPSIVASLGIGDYSRCVLGSHKRRLSDAVQGNKGRRQSSSFQRSVSFNFSGKSGEAAEEVPVVVA